MGELKFNII